VESAVEDDGYEVLTSALMDASAKYASAGESLAQSLARFQSATELSPSVWGRLPGAGPMASHYEEFRRQIITDLAKMHKALASGAASLAASGVRYRATDAAVAALVQGLMKTGFSEQQIATVEKLDAQGAPSELAAPGHGGEEIKNP
jgi:uncharacterized protein YukE